jgi:quinol monooxygenase YgiN
MMILRLSVVQSSGWKLYSEEQFKKVKRVNTFGLYSKIRSQAGQRDELVAVLLDAAAVLQQVSGCQLYIVSVSATEPDTVWVTEVWRSQADHEASLTREDIRPILMRGRPLIAGFERIEIEPIGGKGLSTDVEL